MKLKNYFSPSILAAMVFLTNYAIAKGGDAPRGDHYGRCIQDQINNEFEGQGRNRWAAQCGYIQPHYLDALNAMGLYVVFIEENAPKYAGADCIYGLHNLGMCPLGCFASHQHILFNNRNVEIELAFRDHRKTITALSDDSIPGRIKFIEEDIEYYTSGPQKDGLIKVTANGGIELLVTKSHPLINEQGSVVRADTVIPGMQLLSLEGPVSVLSIQSIPYDGTVFHVRPKSERAKANVFISEGLLTGSLRFQNEWANESNRLRLRSLGSIL